MRSRGRAGDEQSVDAIVSALNDTDTVAAQEVRSYERDHESRPGVIETAEQRIERN